jgi:hypothetical protein
VAQVVEHLTKFKPPSAARKKEYKSERLKEWKRSCWRGFNLSPGLYQSCIGEGVEPWVYFQGNNDLNCPANF